MTLSQRNGRAPFVVSRGLPWRVVRREDYDALLNQNLQLMEDKRVSAVIRGAPEAQDVIDALRFVRMAQKDSAEVVKILDALLDLAPDTDDDRGIKLLLSMICGRPEGVVGRCQAEGGSMTARPESQQTSHQVPPMAIGSTTWPGLAKLSEELGELQQVVGKLMAFPSGGDHPDGGPPLIERLHDELADVDAAIYFVRVYNGLDNDTHVQRRRAKFQRFAGWHQAEVDARTGTQSPQER